MEFETVHHIASLSAQWSRVVHLSFDSSKIRPSFREWVEDPESTKHREDGLVMWFAFVRKLSRLEGNHFKRSLWVLREERGKGGRYHIHAIIRSHLTPQAIATSWKWGRAVVSVFRPDDNIGGYILKSLGSEIESARFSGREQDLSVTWANLAFRLSRAKIAVRMRDEKRPMVAPGLKRR